MNGNELTVAMAFRLSRFTTSPFILESNILIELNMAIKRLEGLPTLPDWLVSEDSWFPLTMGEERAALPDDFIAEVETDNLRLEDIENGEPGTFYNDMTKGFVDDMRTQYGEIPGRPKKYSLNGRYFRVRPIPDKESYRIWMPYLQKQPPLANDTENAWSIYAPDLLIAEAGRVIATALKNQDALALFASLYATETTRLKIERFKKEQENFDPNPED